MTKEFQQKLECIISPYNGLKGYKDDTALDGGSVKIIENPKESNLNEEYY